MATGLMPRGGGPRPPRRTPPRDLAGRALGAARLDPAIYADVEGDRSATPHVVALVLIASAATALGMTARLGVTRIAVGVMVTLVAWAVWAAVAVLVARRMFGARRASPAWRLRVLGLVAVPATVQTLAVVAPFRTPIHVVAHAWMVLAMIVALRRVFDLPVADTGRVAAAALLGWACHVVVLFALLMIVHATVIPSRAATREPAAAMPKVGYVGVVKPSGVAPPVE